MRVISHENIIIFYYLFLAKLLFLNIFINFKIRKVINMKKTNKKYTQIKIRVLPSHKQRIDKLQKSINSEYDFPIFKNDIIRLAIAEFLNNNPDTNTFKSTLEKHNYI